MVKALDLDRHNLDHKLSDYLRPQIRCCEKVSGFIFSSRGPSSNTFEYILGITYLDMIHFIFKNSFSFLKDQKLRFRLGEITLLYFQITRIYLKFWPDPRDWSIPEEMKIRENNSIKMPLKSIRRSASQRLMIVFIVGWIRLYFEQFLGSNNIGGPNLGQPWMFEKLKSL